MKPSANDVLWREHYLGPVNRGDVFETDEGIIVFGNPTSRRLPAASFLELIRWCLLGRVRNAGTRQWKQARRYLRDVYPDISTVVSYSDPSVGHDGALYRACGWLWAPTWHRLREPPTGNGSWKGKRRQAAKDRWVFPLAPDDERAEILRVEDDALRKRFPFAEYREPTWRRGRFSGGGGDWHRWRELVG